MVDVIWAIHNAHVQEVRTPTRMTMQLWRPSNALPTSLYSIGNSRRPNSSIPLPGEYQVCMFDCTIPYCTIPWGISYSYITPYFLSHHNGKYSPQILKVNPLKHQRNNQCLLGYRVRKKETNLCWKTCFQRFTEFQFWAYLEVTSCLASPSFIELRAKPHVYI